ncbi:Ig-like domain-containing protein, partial [Bifidobacterium cuniculi]
MTQLSNPTGAAESKPGKKPGFLKKALAGVVATATLCGGMVIGTSTAVAANAPTTSYDRTLGNAEFEAARNQYGLSKEMSYGSILHAWMWSFNTIKNNMKDIAEAGYTSIQTSPISEIKGPMEGMKFTENWYYVYQPSGSKIGNKVVGTEEELKAMTAEAHKYGIRVIVDGVINHFTADWNAIDPEWRRSDYFHTRDQGGCGDNGTAINYGNRYQVTHCHLLSLWDLNTENQEVGNKMAAFLKQAVADGVDGFRYDAAKHIELPNEFGTYSPYYDTILPNGAQYQYGEVLQGDAGLNAAAYPALFDKYSSNGGGNTGSRYGGTLREALKNYNLNAGGLTNLQGDGVKDNQLVTWVESHDTYANTNEYSSQLTAWQIRMGWAVIGSKAGGAPLFFNRPVGSGGDHGPRFAERSQLGDAGDDEWKSTEVAAVNHFRNAMEGNAEYMRNCQGNNQCLMIERYKSNGSSADDGVTVANMGSDVNLAGMATALDDGTYTDAVNGGTLTVSGKKITSGTAKGGKVSVFSNIKVGPRASVSITAPSSFKTDTTTVTLNASNVSNARYTTSEGASGSFTSGQVITIGANTAAGNTITVTVTGTSEDGTEVKDTKTITKKDPNAVVSYTAYAKKPSSWSTIYAYAYVDNNAAGTNVIENMKWPGVAMTAESNACNGTATHVYEIPEDMIDAAGDSPIRVIFNNGGDGSITGNKFPADTVTTDPDDHVDAAGLLIDGSYVWDGNITSGKWTEASCVAVTVDSIAINGGNITLDVNDNPTAKLTTTITPAAAASAKVTWTSSNTAVATVSNGTVQAVKAGTATITATAGGKSASITVTVTGVRVAPTTTTVYYPSGKFGANSTNLYWHFKGTGEGTWTTAKMTAACDGYVSVTLDNPDQKDIEFVFNNGNGTWDNVGDVSGQNYTATGEYVVIKDNTGNYDTVAPCIVEVPVSSVTISGGNVSLTEGETKALTATVSPANATDRAVSWKSSNTSVATVDSNGKVTAKAKGTATITATAGDKSASVTVTVNAAVVDIPVESITISGTGVADGMLEMNAQTTMSLTASVSPANATNQEVTWKSNNTNLAVVDTNGQVTAKAAGTVVITATAGGRSDAIIVTIRQVVGLQSVTITGDGVKDNMLSMAAGKTAQLTAVLTPSNATVGAVAWSSSNTAVATVDGNGKVTAKKAGSTAIAVYASGKTSAIVVTVSGSVPVSDSKGDSLGVRRGTMLYLNNQLKGNNTDVQFAYGLEGDEVFVGDWDGDGKDTVAVRRGATFYVRNELSAGMAQAQFTFGRPGDEVIVGDWDGDGRDTFGVRRGTMVYLCNELNSKVSLQFNYGRAGDELLVGDWDGDGRDTLGVRRGTVMYLVNSLMKGSADVQFVYGRSGDEVLVGDWDGDGRDTLGVRRGTVMYLNNQLKGGNASVQ